MSIICVIALPWKAIKIFSLCRYKAITSGRRYSGKQVVQVYGLTFCRLRAAYIGSFTMLFSVVY